jgi:hypothetical protein
VRCRSGGSSRREATGAGRSNSSEVEIGCDLEAGPGATEPAIAANFIGVEPGAEVGSPWPPQGTVSRQGPRSERDGRAGTGVAGRSFGAPARSSDTQQQDGTPLHVGHLQWCSWKEATAWPELAVIVAPEAGPTSQNPQATTAATKRWRPEG